MPVESAPVLDGPWAQSGPTRQATPASIDALSRIEVAPRELVEPVMRTARRRVASLRLTARAAAHRAAAAEEALAVEDGATSDTAGQDAELAALRAAIDDLRAGRDEVLLAARRDAAALVESARAGSRADVAAAREELDRSLAATTLAVAAVTDTGPIDAEAEVSSPDPGPGGRPASSPAPTLPPPAPVAPTSPAPSYPPPAPAAASYQAVLIQNQDGTFQTAFVRTDVGLPMGMAPFGAAPFAGPAPVVAAWPSVPGVAGPVPSMVPATVAAPSAPAEPIVRRLLHLDVVLPLVAVLIVLVVLLAWLG